MVLWIGGCPHSKPTWTSSRLIPARAETTKARRLTKAESVLTVCDGKKTPRNCRERTDRRESARNKVFLLESVRIPVIATTRESIRLQ